MERFELSVKEILECTKGSLEQGTLCTFSGVSTDTRMIGPGQLYVAIKGKNFDGHEFVADAKAKGALGALVSKDVEIPEDDFVVIKVPDTRHGLLSIAGFWRRKNPQTQVIAVTGTNGKTTTKEMIRWLLSAVGPTVASVKSYNNDIGVPLSLLEIRPYHRYCVIEIGASAPGEILPLAAVALPSVSVITNIGIAHLEGFKTRSNIIQTKGEIIKAIDRRSEKRFAVLNADDPAFPELKEFCKDIPYFTFGITSKDADVRPDSPETVVEQTSAVHFSLSETPLSIPMGGTHNLYNALAALAVMKGLDLDLIRSAKRLSTFTPPPMRSNMFYVGPVVVINDAFNCNPSSLGAAINYFDTIKSPNKLFVLGDMLELGSESPMHHIAAGERLAASTVNHLFLTGNEVSATESTFSAKSGKPVYHYAPEAHTEMVAQIGKIVEGGGVVFFKGSRANRLEDTVSLLLRRLKSMYGHD
ncbi:MAG: UDP-N-acetylmuramoyl-tripeptide--D-alanyl-D-alanine ligase [Candidatus Brocadiia bacterium]